MAASSMSRWWSASSVRSGVVTTRSNAPRAWPSSRASSSRKWTRAAGAAISAELARDVVLRAGVVRVREDLVRRRVLDDRARAAAALVVELDREEGRHVRYA